MFSSLFNSLKSKLIVPILATFVVVVGIIAFVVNSEVSNIINMTATQQLHSAISSINTYFETLEEQVLMSANAIAGSYEVISIVRSVEDGADESTVAAQLLEYLALHKQHSSVNAIVIVDPEGIALARSHLPTQYGDFGAGPPALAALDGLRVTMYTPTPTVPLVLAGAAPIISNGEIIGGIASMIDIGLEDTVDYISESFGADVSIFWETPL